MIGFCGSVVKLILNSNQQSGLEFQHTTRFASANNRLSLESPLQQFSAYFAYTAPKKGGNALGMKALRWVLMYCQNAVENDR
ncbi:hypothetical protein F441_02517 [Phytophthora nicotianae CJ01A1]|uniref:Uncharacterized protein n=2 Tax=Phytophthora nicotianae TaxID=4792 RepID=W2XQ24_PHYNI|nr:hypothetical protein F444_02565 [Phytophthora nicotianae P1976]ETP24498.1 hypothetical protein F441_02517 [Phytophthora nicotianae CJ01A1]